MDTRPVGYRSADSVRAQALAALWPHWRQDEAVVDALVVDGIPHQSDLPQLVLAPTRPAALPPQARWLASPARPATLQAALTELLASASYAFFGGTLSFTPPQLTIGATQIALTDREAELLRHLQREPTGVAREALLAQHWGMAEDVQTHSLETQLYRLRQKLREGFGARLELELDGGVCVLRALA